MAHETHIVDDELPAEIEAALAALTRLGTEELWGIARRPAPIDLVDRLADLNDRRQRVGLDADEEGEADALAAQLGQAMALRAEAVALLHERGQDVRDLVAHA
jgi:hypothetical protein